MEQKYPYPICLNAKQYKAAVRNNQNGLEHYVEHYFIYLGFGSILARTNTQADFEVLPAQIHHLLSLLSCSNYKGIIYIYK